MHRCSCAPDVLDQFLVEFVTQRDDLIQVFRPYNDNSFISLTGPIEFADSSFHEETHNESSTLLLIGVREEVDRFKDLNASI